MSVWKRMTSSTRPEVQFTITCLASHRRLTDALRFVGGREVLIAQVRPGDATELELLVFEHDQREPVRLLWKPLKQVSAIATVLAQYDRDRIQRPSGVPFAIVGTDVARTAIALLEDFADDSTNNGDERQKAWDASGSLYDAVRHRDHLFEQVTQLQERGTELQNDLRTVRAMLDGALSAAEGAPRSANPYPPGEGSAPWSAAYNTVQGAISAASIRQPITIDVTRRGEDDWTAQTSPQSWEAGTSAAGAVGKFALGRCEELGLLVRINNGEGH